MNEKCCRNCVYATGPQGRWHRVMIGRFPGLRVCFNHPETPGQMREVRVEALCENYRARHWPKGKRDRPPKPPHDEIRYIPLTHGLYAIVDAQDYEKLSQHKWYARFHDFTVPLFPYFTTSLFHYFATSPALSQKMVPSIGIEPMTFPMSRERATAAPTGPLPKLALDQA